VLVKTRDMSCDQTSESDFMANYAFDPIDVAEALLAHIELLADQRARFRRSLMWSVEMIETPDLDLDTVGRD
jgi:hypothetical protein